MIPYFGGKPVMHHKPAVTGDLVFLQLHLDAGYVAINSLHSQAYFVLPGRVAFVNSI